MAKELVSNIHAAVLSTTLEKNPIILHLFYYALLFYVYFTIILKECFIIWSLHYDISIDIRLHFSRHVRVVCPRSNKQVFVVLL